MSTIWSSRALKRSFCPLSRRSFGRIESPSAKLTERQNHDQTPQSMCKKSSLPPQLSCECEHSPTPATPKKISPLQILHGRLNIRQAQPWLWVKIDTHPQPYPDRRWI